MKTEPEGKLNYINPPDGIAVTKVKLICHFASSPTTFKVESLLKAIVTKFPGVRD